MLHKKIDKTPTTPTNSRNPIGAPLNLRDDPSRAIESLRAMGDYPPADKPNSRERPGHWPEPGGRHSLDAAIEWLATRPPKWNEAIVYGFQGYNRYAVYGDGEIHIIESQLDFTNGLESRNAALLRARELGFFVK